MTAMSLMTLINLTPSRFPLYEASTATSSMCPHYNLDQNRIESYSASRA